MARILLGVTGGIAAYKSVELVRLAMKAGHSVRVVQTEASTRFVGTATFAGITGAPVLTTEWERDPLRGSFPGDVVPDHDPLSHLELVANADALVVAPCSANTLAKLAAGQADNLLTTGALAVRAGQPVLVAPAMNDRMWAHPATVANVAALRARGVTVLEPGVGALGSIGEHGAGRLPEPADLLASIERALAGPPRDLEGLQVLVTAGGTREPIDAVRFVGNRSSGRMGVALATEAARRGAKVTLVAANVGLDHPPGVAWVAVETAAQLHAETLAAFATADVLLMAAAVADYRPAQVFTGKVKKDAQGEALAIELERTEDVLSDLAGRRRDGQTLVGFAAETGEGAIEYGRGKLRRKGLDAVVVNDVAQPGIGFDTPDNAVTLVTADGEEAIPRASKAEVARAILDRVLSWRSSGVSRVG